MLYQNPTKLHVHVQKQLFHVPIYGKYEIVDKQ